MEKAAAKSRENERKRLDQGELQVVAIGRRRGRETTTMMVEGGSRLDDREVREERGREKREKREKERGSEERERERKVIK